ncbi:MAG: hypothetical protein V2A71_07475 [Candidatus Eisenbacteria bacterium]
MIRYVCLVAACALLVSALGCCPAKHRLAGTWEMVFPMKSGETPISHPQTVLRGLKLLNDTHFAFGFWTTDGQIFAGGGRYALDGKTYTETIDYHFNPALVGMIIPFDCILQDSLWYHSGAFEAAGQPMQVNEVWRRIK